MMPFGIRDVPLIIATAGVVLLSSCSKRTENGGKANATDSNHVGAVTLDDGRGFAGQSKQEVVFSRLRSEPNELRAGDSFRLILNVQIAPGWHIAAIDRPTGVAAATKIDLLLPAGLEQTGPWQAVDQPIPDPQVEGLVFMYTDKITFHCAAKAIGKFESERATIGCVLHYQACNQFICRLPESLELETEIHFVK